MRFRVLKIHTRAISEEKRGFFPLSFATKTKVVKKQLCKCESLCNELDCICKSSCNHKFINRGGEMTDIKPVSRHNAKP